MAGRLMQFERGSHTLQATGLVHEVYMRLVANDGLRINDKEHFFAIAAVVAILSLILAVFLPSAAQWLIWAMILAATMASTGKGARRSPSSDPSSKSA